MTTPDAKRRLSAILVADLVGYSRLMRDDNAAIREITGLRKAGLEFPVEG